MIGRWAKAAAMLVLFAAIVVDLGLATALLDHAPRDLPAALAALAALGGPGPRLALAGREALLGGAIAGAASAGAALLLGSAAALLSGAARALLLALLLVPGVTALLLGLLAATMLLAASGPVTAARAGYAVAVRPLGADWTLAIVLLPVAVAIVEPVARRLDDDGFRSLASLGIGPLRRLFAVALPAVLPAAVKAAIACFCLAAAILFLAAWPVPARQDAVAALAATVAVPPLAAAAFCAACVVALLAALLSRPVDAAVVRS